MVQELNFDYSFIFILILVINVIENKVYVSVLHPMKKNVGWKNEVRKE